MRQVATGVQTADLGYFYDDLGRLSRVDSSDPLRREQLNFDELGRLRWSQRLGDAHYADPAHVHAVTATDYGAQRRYDGNGNMTYLKDPTNASNPVGRELKLGWSIDDKVTQIDDILHSQGFRFTYDIGGRRAIKKELNGNTSRYFGPLLELKTDPSGNSKLVKYYLAGDTLVAKNDGNSSYFHADVAHATRLETDLTGHVANTYQYWSFGEPYKSTQTIANDIGYSGARTDEALGLISMGARVYDPVLGQFLSADSVIPNTFRPQSLNRYSYVENDPVNHWDPSGHLRASVEYQKMREAETTFAQLRAALNQCNNPFVSCGVPGSFHFAFPKMFDERVVLADPTDPLGSIHVDEPSPPPAGDSGSKSDDKAWRHPDDDPIDKGKSIDELIAKYGEGDGGTGQCQIGCQIGRNIAAGKPRPSTDLEKFATGWFLVGMLPAAGTALLELGVAEWVAAGAKRALDGAKAAYQTAKNAVKEALERAIKERAAKKAGKEALEKIKRKVEQRAEEKMDKAVEKLKNDKVEVMDTSNEAVKGVDRGTTGSGIH
jgi:RHS repeat-associated protein